MTTLSIHFFDAWKLWVLILVPALLILYAGLSSARANRMRSHGMDDLQRVLPKDRPWVRHLAVMLASLSLASLIVAWARPKTEVLVPRDRATVIITIDVSKSMMATDVKPDRISAVKTGATSFVDGMPQRFNVGLVKFAGTASMVVPPTTDRQMIKSAINALQLAPSTAIGEGVYASLDALAMAPSDPTHPNDPPPSAIVLLSDGGSNMGRSSLSAGKHAKEVGVPVDTIAYGTEGGYINEGGRNVQVSVNKYELQQLANASGGKMYTAQSGDELKQVYAGLASTIGFEKQDKEITSEMIWVGLLSAVLAACGVISIAARWP